MLHLTADGRFSVLDIPLPVNRVVTDPGKAAGSAVDAEINVGKMLVVCDFGSLLHAKISGISIDDLVIFAQ